MPGENNFCFRLILLVFFLFFFFSFSFFGAVSGIEPGKGNQDFDSIEEVKSHDESSPSEPEPEDVSWVPEAVLDVAYYLRKYKNNGYDPRYLTEGAKPEKNLYVNFPSPPLSNLYWEVNKNCETSFTDCLKYLQDKISQTELPRHLDSLTVIKHNGWSMDKDRDLIKATNDACLELQERDEKTFNVFRGPLQKFQWLISASYYMCWYTMKEVYHLETFQDSCDNFANCLDWNTGPSNGDFRASNERPFACASYSFCPDPCCPVKLAHKLKDCESANPCSRNKASDNTCAMERKKNVDFDSLILNYWNLSCRCDEPGTKWESRSGMCVDVDECIETESPCPGPSQSCMNLPGSYRCVCNMMGYEDDGHGGCDSDPIVQEIIHPQKSGPGTKKPDAGGAFFGLVDRVKTIISGPGNEGSSRGNASRKREYLPGRD